MGSRSQHDGWPLSRTLSLCVGVLLAGAPAFAQGPPTAFWTFALRAQEAWYSNPFLTGATPGVFNTRAGAGLGYTRESPLGQFAASADAAFSFDNQTQGRNRISYSGVLDWKRELGPHTTLQLKDSVSQLYAQSTPLLAESGLIFPYTLIRSNSSLLSVSQQLSTRTSLTASGRYYWVDFPGSNNLASGQQATAALELGRALSERDQLGLLYSYRWSDTQGPIFETHSLSASWLRGLGVATSGSVSAGASYVNSPSQGVSRYILDVSGFLRGQVRSTSYTLTYSRAPQQVYGFNRERIADVLAMRLRRPLSRALSVSARGVRTWGRDLVDPTFRYDTQVLSAGLELQPKTDLRLGLGYDWIRVALNGILQQSHSLYVATSYGWRWR